MPLSSPVGANTGHVPQGVADGRGAGCGREFVAAGHALCPRQRMGMMPLCSLVGANTGHVPREVWHRNEWPLDMPSLRTQEWAECRCAHSRVRTLDMSRGRFGTGTSGRWTCLPCGPRSGQNAVVLTRGCEHWTCPAGGLAPERVAAGHALPADPGVGRMPLCSLAGANTGHVPRGGEGQLRLGPELSRMRSRP
jgi:hypothetical protein